MTQLPAWAQKMKENFVSGVTSQFIIHGSVFDFVPNYIKEKIEFISLVDFLVDVLFAPFDVVLLYDRGKGILAKKGRERFFKFLEIYDSFNQTNYATYPGNIPRNARDALELISRFIQAGTQGVLSDIKGKNSPPLKIAVVIDYAAYVIPQGATLNLVGDLSENLIKIIDWASNPAILDANIATCLISENLSDLNTTVVNNPYNAKIEIKLPNNDEVLEYVKYLTTDKPDFNEISDLGYDSLADKLTGLSRVNIRNIVLGAIKNNRKITIEFVTAIKKELIEKECSGLLEFIETPYNLEMISGHNQAKNWLKEDALLIKRGKLNAIPMGYLLTGRIGIGKTFLATCWAGEIGIPCVVFKNFRDKWQGATEGNLEKIFNILRALGQVLVFIDEADQACGRRDSGDGDSGVSGRIYAMLAKQMGDTRNRGKIIWIFATSRPDLLEVDLKRKGRLDVHIPLFPPQDEKERVLLFGIMAKKMGVIIKAEDLPKLPEDFDIAGNEMESLIVRAIRKFELQDETVKKEFKDILADVIADFRPSAQIKQLEFMDMLAVKECTDDCFLPVKYKELTITEIDDKINRLQCGI